MAEVSEMVKSLLAELRQMVRTETVVGAPIQAGDSTVVPVSRVSFGFAGGGGKGAGEQKETTGGSGIGGGASIEPVAFIIITEGKAQVLSVQDKGGLSFGKVIDLIPEIVEQLKDFKSKAGKKKAEKREDESAV